MRTLAEANKYLSTRRHGSSASPDPERMRTICHVALQLVDDGKTLLTPVPAGIVAAGLRDARRHRGLVRDARIDEVTEDGGLPLSGNHR